VIFKTSAVLETQRETRISRHTSNVPTLDLPALSDHSSPRLTQVAPQDLEGYQITFLPFSDQENGSEPEHRTMGRMLLVPLTWSQLVSQVRREMAQPSKTTRGPVLRFGQVRIDLQAMEVSRSDRPVRLTAMEFKVLQFFVSNPNRVISRDDLLNEVWGYANYPCTRTVDNHVLKLRQKLEEEAAQPIHFRTVHRVGYKFTP
jgi:DNA-binding winged helix-turn-helix (wHTH) protein